MSAREIEYDVATRMLELLSFFLACPGYPF